MAAFSSAGLTERSANVRYVNGIEGSGRAVIGIKSQPERELDRDCQSIPRQVVPHALGGSRVSRDRKSSMIRLHEVE